MLISYWNVWRVRHELIMSWLIAAALITGPPGVCILLSGHLRLLWLFPGATAAVFICITVKTVLALAQQPAAGCSRSDLPELFLPSQICVQHLRAAASQSGASVKRWRLQPRAGNEGFSLKSRPTAASCPRSPAPTHNANKPEKEQYVRTTASFTGLMMCKGTLESPKVTKVSHPVLSSVKTVH